MSASNRKGSLLLSVLRDLTDSYDEEERKSQRKRLKAEQERAQAALNKVIGDHQDRLQLALDVYTKVDARIRTSQERVVLLKKKLTECKGLLRCRQEDLRQLWIENVKYKQMLKLFDSIEKVKTVPEEVARYRARKHYLHASEKLMCTIQDVQRKLKGVEALKDIRVDLGQLKEALHLEILEEINKHLYIKPKPKPKVVPEAKHLSSSPLIAAKRATIGRHSRTLSRTIQMEHEAAQRLAQIAAKTLTKDTVEEDLTLLDPEENKAYYMDILVESLQFLGTLEPALLEIQGDRMEREFRMIVDRIAKQVTQSAEHSGWHQHKAKLLATLLEKSFDKFRAVVDAHNLLLLSFNRVKKSYGLGIEVYTESDVWTVVQQVLQNQLSEYYQIKAGIEVGHGAIAPESSDIGNFFQKKKWSSGRGRPVLFRFDHSDHHLMRGEQPGKKKESDNEAQFDPMSTTPLVCSPTIFNVTKTFAIICDFASEIEAALHYPPDEPCSLRTFVVTFVEHKFIDDIGHDFKDQVDKAISGDNLLKLVDPKQQKITALPKKILACVVVMWQLVERLRKLIADLPVYSTKFLFLMTVLLEEFHLAMAAIYRNVVSSAGIGQNLMGHTTVSVLSARWCQEEETRQLMKGASSWSRVFGKEKGPGEADLAAEQGGSVFERETDFLFRMMPTEGQKLEGKEVVFDSINLKKIANLHEAMEWFSQRLFAMVCDITQKGVDPLDHMTPNPSHSNPLNEIPEDVMEREKQSLQLIKKLSKIASQYRSLAETTIIMLHLEVRVHCFYHLHKAVHKSLSPVPTVFDLKPGVSQLKKDLDWFEGNATQCLADPKIKYIFDGLGHLLATIFIRSAGHLQPSTPSAIKKMCGYIASIHQVVASKTQTKEDDLEKARQFFELLQLNPQEFVKVIQEQGKAFPLADYERALLLIGKAQQRDITQMLSVLRNMFSDDAI